MLSRINQLASCRTSLLSGVLAVALLALACGGDNTPADDPTETGPATPTARNETNTPGEPTAVGSSLMLAAGTFQLPAAESFGEAGFHEPIIVTDVISEDLGSTAGATLSVVLRDVSRPQQDCSSQHPLSGCATVDWSDDEDRPKVPPGGVLDNRLSLSLGSASRDLFLSESGNLATSPDAFQPG